MQWVCLHGTYSLIGIWTVVIPTNFGDVVDAVTTLRFHIFL